MELRTHLNTSYEELHRSFVLKLLELKNGHGQLAKLREFLRGLARISRSSAQETIILDVPHENVLRIHFKFKPLYFIRDGERIEEPQPDWLVDFLFCDSYKTIGQILDFLSTNKDSVPVEKRALIHFGCSPDSFSGDIARDAMIRESSPYTVFHSINPYELSNFLGDGKDFGDGFFEIYAGILRAYAKKKALSTWQRNGYAFAFLCENVIVDALEKKIGKPVLVRASLLSWTESIVCVTLPQFEWVLTDGDTPVDSIFGVTLRIHFISGFPVAQLGLSHYGPTKAHKIGEKPIVKETYEKLFFKKFDLRKAGFRWVNDIEDPLDDEFAYSIHPLWIFSPWEDERPEMRLCLTSKDLSGCLVDDIAAIFDKIEKLR